MAIYDTEEEQVEALKRWWKENGTSTVVGLAIGIAIIVGWNFRQNYVKEQSSQASAIFDQILKSAETEQKDTLEKQAKSLQEKYAGTNYATYGNLFLAKLKVQQGDLKAAKEILQKIVDGKDKELSHVARIRLVKLMLATGEYEPGLKLINAVDQSEVAKFSDSYDELVGDLYVALDRLDEARTAYEKALKSGNQSPLLRLKIDDLSSPEKVEAKK